MLVSDSRSGHCWCKGIDYIHR